MRYVRIALLGLLTGSLFVGSVWAGVGLGPVDDAVTPPTERAPAASIVAEAAAAAIGEGETLGDDELLAGAAKVDLFPQPNESKGERWVRDKAKCTPVTSGDAETTKDHAADWRITWIENNNCIYMGGFGIGPSQPVIEWDTEYGLWSRSAAFVRDGKAVVVTILDAEGYFGSYNRMCGTTPCGAFDIAKDLAKETGLDAASFIFASTHAHSAMDFIGGWGGVPQWYMDQTAAAMKSSVRRALGIEACPADTCVPLQPATVEAGETLARGNNSERRDTYRSAEDPTVNWLRARGRDGAVITTVGTFAAHATSFGSRAIKAHADWPGVFAETAEDRFGGIGLMFEAGLGNMSSRGGHMMGKTLADQLPAVGAGTLVTNPVVNAKQEFWDQPVTNGPLGALGGAGFFDRPFGGPAAVDAAKPNSNKPCRSSSPLSARVAVTAAKIGGVIISAAPGEIFANYSNTIEEKAPVIGLAIGQANDALGYMPQSFESDATARQGTGFVGGGVFEYEDAYSIDHCFGDKALETTLKLVGQL